MDLRLSVVESLFDSIDRLIFNRPHIRLNPIMKEHSYFLKEGNFSLQTQPTPVFSSSFFLVHTYGKLILKKIKSLNLAKMFGFVLTMKKTL